MNQDIQKKQLTKCWRFLFWENCSVSLDLGKKNRLRWIPFVYSQSLSLTPQPFQKLQPHPTYPARGLQALCNSSNKSTKITANRVNLNHLSTQPVLRKLGIQGWKVGCLSIISFNFYKDYIICFDEKPQPRKVGFTFKKNKTASSHGGNLLFFTVFLILCLTPSCRQCVNPGFPQLQMLLAPQLWRTLPGTTLCQGLGSFPTAGKSQLFGWNLLNQHNMTHHHQYKTTGFSPTKLKWW